MTKGLFIVLVLTTFWIGPVEGGDDLEGAVWMRSNAGSRATYVIGFMNGLEYVVRLYGGELRSARDSRVTYDEMSEVVYRRLVREPELRQGPMSEIIVSTLMGPYVMITDRSGNPIPTK